MFSLSPELQIFIVLAVIALLIIGLVADKIRPHYLFFGAVMFLMLVGITSPKDFLHSFANESIVTIFVLIFITVGINANYNILKYLDQIFIQKKRPKLFLIQMTGVVSVLSGVMNNTPVVALLVPYVLRWSKKMNVSPSKLLLPLSFAAISGGMITVIGTSTNLVLNGFIEAEGGVPLDFHHYLFPGLMVSGVLVIFLSFVGYYLLTQRKNPVEYVQQNLKEYLVEISLDENSIHQGKTVNEAGLRNLHGVYLVEILRNGRVISPVAPDEILAPNDRLFFAGDTTAIVEIVKEENGFKFPKTKAFDLKGNLEIVETLIPYNSQLAGKTLKENGFRDQFDAAVVAIHRNGERLRGKLGDIKLEYGDLLLLTAGKHFNAKINQTKDLYALTIKDQLGKPSPYKSMMLLLVAIVTIVLMLSGVLSFFLGMLLILAAFFVLGLMGESTLKNNHNIDLFLILGCSIALGSTFIETGAAKWLADGMLSWVKPFGDLAIILGIYILTVLLTTFISNAASVAIVFPIAFEMGAQLGLPMEAVYLTIAFGASCCFLTPYAYQTNLMVYGPGGYRFRDYFKLGLPVAILYSVVFFIYLTLNYPL